MREEIETEIKHSAELIDALSVCMKGCSNIAALLSGKAEDEEKEAAKTINDALSGWKQPSDLSKAIEVFGVAPGLDQTRFDDLKYWIRLPLPINAIPPDARTLIESTSASVTVEQKKQTFARYLYQHWVQRQDQARCRLYGDCLDHKRQYEYYDEILRTFFDDQGKPFIVKKSTPAPNSMVLTIAPCFVTKITNTRSALAPNFFSVTELDSNGKPKIGADGKTPIVLISEQPGERSAGISIPSSTASRDILVEGWYGLGGFFIPNPSKLKMVSSSVHYTASLSTVVWFQDPGSSASVGPNLAIYFQAIPDPSSAGCPRTLDTLKKAAIE
jgi:hypothetical protein